MGTCASTEMWVVADTGMYWSHHVQDTIIALDEEVARGNKVGLDVATGEPMDPTLAGIYDNLSVKRQMLQSAPVVASQLLLVDEVIRAHIRMKQ